MIKYKHILLWSLGMAVVLGLMSFAHNRKKQVLWQQTQISVAQEQSRPFVTQQEVRSIIARHYPLSEGIPLQEINIALLEESLDNHPSIKKAEVYSLWNGTLHISVQQHEPKARVLSAGRSFYLLNDGGTMPLSTNYSAKVPLITGAVPDSLLGSLSNFWNTVESHAFFADFFSGITVAQNGDWILHPLPGQHKVLLGQPQHLDRKLKKLEIFYQQAVNSKNLDSIKTLNLKFSNQVVCRKN